MPHPEQLGINPKFLEEYLLAIYRVFPELNKEDLYLAAYGSEIRDVLRPMVNDAPTMIEEFQRKLPPYDEKGLPQARWRLACWKSYEAREQMPENGRNSVKEAPLSLSQEWMRSKNAFNFISIPYLFVFVFFLM
jgi:hypothetical protein